MSDTVVDQLYRSVRGAWPELPALTGEQVAALHAHYSLLRKWNPKINLVGASTLETAAVKHYAESLYLASLLPDGMEAVLDVGSGAGFPGFPLAVLRPDVRVTLVESDRRKAAFLRESCTLSNVTVLCRRLDEVDSRIDAVITRAVDPRVVVSWGADHARHFGFLGSTSDCLSLRQHPSLLDAVSSLLPWLPSSSVLWGMFHVEQSA
ncbi:MAG: 16S rRNA (guanine(527)-N(7))-methyltransferase RsmG [Bryobacteraceae bacterium]|nr:16S rRNA (guanine(527)-N(7))-methyltransferase RsmG [Bryobacteraceae bacterium]